jgi:hypothetical protein
MSDDTSAQIAKALLVCIIQTIRLSWPSTRTTFARNRIIAWTKEDGGGAVGSLGGGLGPAAASPKGRRIGLVAHRVAAGRFVMV